MESLGFKAQDVDCPRKKIKLDEAENVQSVMDHHVLAENNQEAEEGSEEKVDMTELNGDNPKQILLRIPDTRDKILGLLSHEDMRNFRLTNSLWNNIVSTYMLKNETPVVTFEFHSRLKEYRSPTKYGSRSIPDILDRLSKSKIFPYNNFSFVGGENFSDVEANWVILFRQFFSTLGPQIKALCIKDDHSSPMTMNMDTLRSILLVDAPNVQTLNLSYFPNLAWNDSNRLSLPALKSLTCLSATRESTAFDMLGDAPSLECVKDFEIKYIDSFLSKFKIDLIKYWRPIGHPRLLDVQNLLTLAVAQPKLTGLYIPLQNRLPQQPREDFVRAVNLILDSSIESLLWMRIYAMSMDGLIFPQLTNVKTVQFIPIAHNLFPVGMRLSDIFPRVEDVEWYFPPGAFNYKSLIPPETDLATLTAVHTLSVGTRYVADFLENLGRLIPNVTTLRIHGIRSRTVRTALEGQVFEPILTQYPNITSICIKDSMGQLLPTFSDCSLTGIPEEMCEQLRQSNEQLIKELCDVKTRAGISDFKCLKQLKIVLDNDRWISVNLSRPLLPSWVSGVYGFSRLPDLKVTTAFNQYCPSSSIVQFLLTPLVPYVTLAHEVT